MITRRTFIAMSVVSPVLSRTRGINDIGISNSSEKELDVTHYVNVFIGTGGHGHTYPAATCPFGAVQLGPDTGVKGWDHCSGYHYDDSTLLGFSHTHLSGTGAADMLDFLIMPGTGEPSINPKAGGSGKEQYRADFSHMGESTRPGYYSLNLKEPKVQVELTATERVGFHRYTFAADTGNHLILDLSHLSGGDVSALNYAQIRLADQYTLIGSRSTNLWAAGREQFFAMRFSIPINGARVYRGDGQGERDQESISTATAESRKEHLRVLIPVPEGQRIIMIKTGISGVSSEGALRNLNAEIPGWDFDTVASNAQKAWNEHLSRVIIETNDERLKQIFYTGLYHTLIAPTLFDDVDGQYRGMDGKTHRLSPGEHNYSSFSLWDTYRATHPLHTLILADRAPTIVNALVRMGLESPAGAPVWPLQGKETGTMVGYHSASVVAEALVKRMPGIDAESSYKLFRQRAMQDDYRGLVAYRKFGYVPYDLQDESASKTMDYAYDDWAVSKIAASAGYPDEAQHLERRSKSYRNLYDPRVGFIRPKSSTGEWAGSTFDPKEITISKKWRDYTESNAWQTTFSVQHDPDGLAEMLGGKAALCAKLDALFSQSSELPADMPPDVAGLVGQYAHGNEPCHHIAYLYNYAGAPQKTQARVRALMAQWYDNKPNGLAGNEDCGQMSAWFLMSSLGFYPVDPVSGEYDIGTPLFDKAHLRIGDGKVLTIESSRQSPRSIYVKQVQFNGVAIEGLRIRHSDLANGGRLVYQLVDDLQSDSS